MSEAKLQNATNGRIVPAWYFDAMALKMQGYKYDQIAERVNKNVVTVRKLFARSGAMYEFWRGFVEDNKVDQIEEALDMAFAHLGDAMRTHIIAGQNPKSITGLEARRDIFSYTLGKPEQRLKLDAKVGIFNFTDWALAQVEKMKQTNDGRPDQTIDGVSAGSA